MLSVPFGLMGSFLFAKMWGLENNIYMQTGLIMLIGLLAKTAILLTEYASARRRQGMTIAQAAVSAAGVRLRPILMTALSSAFALIPLALRGDLPGNEIQSPMAKVILGGLLTSTFLNAFVIPIVYELMNRKKNLKRTEE